MINTISTAGLAAVETLINKSLQYDPATQQALSALSGKILLINISAPKIKLAVLIEEKNIRLMSLWDGAVDTELSGSLISLAQIANTPVYNLKDTGITAMGDLHFLVDLQKIIKKLDIDWEEMLSQLLGDIIGHQTAQMIRHKMSWTRNRTQTAQRLIGEFVTEELGAIPSKIELKNFYNQVDEVRLAVDRLEAKLNNLTAS